MSRLEDMSQNGQTWLYDKVGNMSCSYSSSKERQVAIRQLAEAAYFAEYPKGFPALAMKIAKAEHEAYELDRSTRQEISRRIAIFAEFGIKLNARGVEQAKPARRNKYG